MPELKSPKKQELQKVIQFLNTNLRKDFLWSIADEYPLAFSEKNCHNIKTIFDGEKILCHAVIKILIIKTPVAIFKAAAIGSVVTNTENRNQGLSSQIIAECIKEAEAQDCDFAILWTDIYDFYRRLNFELAGTEVAALIDSPLQVPPKSYKYLSTNRVSPTAILKLYNKHTITNHRTEADIAKFLNIPNATVYTAWNSNNQLKAYAVEGRGADFKNYIHEWGGESEDILALLNQVHLQIQAPLTAIIPKHSQNLLNQLSLAGASLSFGYLGMIRITNHKNLLFKVLRHARSLGFNNFNFEQTDQGFLVGLKGKEQLFDSDRKLVNLIFGPHLANELGTFDTESLEVLERILPLPLWVWGWDSV